MYKCCIFDLDGTLIDSIKAISHTCNLTLNKYNLGPIEENDYKVYVGEGYKKLVERALIHCGDKDLANYEDALITYMDYFKIHCMHEVVPYDGITNMLEFLKKNNIKVAILSNKPHERTIDNVVVPYDGITNMLEFLKKNNIKVAILSNKPHERTIDNVNGVFGNDYFDRVSGEVKDIKRKPDPQGAIITAKELGVLPQDCLYIGDTDTDMKTGIAAKMDTVGVTWGFRNRKELSEYNPKYIIDRPEEIISILKESNNIK